MGIHSSLWGITLPLWIIPKAWACRKLSGVMSRLNPGVSGGDSFHFLKWSGLKRIISVLPVTSFSVIGAGWYIHTSQILEANTYILKGYLSMRKTSSNIGMYSRLKKWRAIIYATNITAQSKYIMYIIPHSSLFICSIQYQLVWDNPDFEI